MYLQLPQSTKFVYGMLRIAKNFSEFKFRDLNVIVFSSCMMENQSFQVGVTVRLEHSYLNLENYCMSLTMHIITDAQL